MLKIKIIELKLYVYRIILYEWKVVKSLIINICFSVKNREDQWLSLINQITCSHFINLIVTKIVKMWILNNDVMNVKKFFALNADLYDILEQVEFHFRYIQKYNWESKWSDKEKWSSQFIFNTPSNKLWQMNEQEECFTQELNQP